MRSRRHLGHSPAGGAMVLALMIGLTALTATGLVVYAVREGQGPLSGVIEQARAPTVDATGAPLSARQQRFQRPGREWREAHEIVANAMLVLIALHIGGVLLASYAHRENLAKEIGRAHV